MTLILKSAYAKHRGVTPAAVTTAIKSGRIAGAVVTQNGKQLIDLEKADALWTRNTLQQPPPTTAGPAPAPPTVRQLRDLIQSLPEDEIPDLNESRARREHYQAEKARLEALQGRGELVPAADVRKEAFNLARAVRDKLMGIADRLAPQLAATQDARVCHHLLSEEIRVALRGLADG